MALAIIAAGNMGLWFLFQWQLLQNLGAGSKTDALFAAMTLPQFFQMLVVPGVTNTLVPFFAGEKRSNANWQLWQIFSVMLLLSSLVALGLIFTAEFWVGLAFGGFSTDGFVLTLNLLPQACMAMVCIITSAVVTAFLNAFHKFLAVELVGLFVSATAVLGCVLISKGITAEIAVWFVFGRAFFQLMLLILLAGFNMDQPDDVMDWGGLFKKFGTTMLGTTVTKTDPLFDRYFTSQMSSGILSMYYMAQQAVNAVTFVFHKAIVAPRQPRFVELFKNNKAREQRSLLNVSILYIFAISLVGIAVFFVFGKQAIDVIVWDKSSLSGEKIYSLWAFSLAMSGSLVFGCIGSLLNAQFFAAGDMATPTKLMIVLFVASIILKFTLFGYLGAVGIALATSLFYLFYCLTMYGVWLVKAR